MEKAYLHLINFNHQDESIIDKDKANPIGLISSVDLMLRYSFKLHEEADIIERAIERAIDKGIE